MLEGGGCDSEGVPLEVQQLVMMGKEMLDCGYSQEAIAAFSRSVVAFSSPILIDILLLSLVGHRTGSGADACTIAMHPQPRLWGSVKVEGKGVGMGMVHASAATPTDLAHIIRCTRGRRPAR